MIRRVSWLVIASFILTLFGFTTGHATNQPPNKGLLVTPIREYVKADAGKTTNGSLTIANITDKPATVDLSVKQFSVANYSYGFKFAPVKEDWVKLQSSQLQLQPGKRQTVAYSITVPEAATPGGHYFTIFASAALDSGSPESKVRAATVLYVTVNGQLQQTSEIEKETIPWISFGNAISFTFDVKNTGNTHFFVYPSGKLSGWTVKPLKEETAHILMPNTIRTIEGTIAMPLLPGLYPATYGYRTDDGQIVTHTAQVLYVPPWSLVIPLGIIWIAILLRKRQKRISKIKTTDS